MSFRKKCFGLATLACTLVVAGQLQAKESSVLPTEKNTSSVSNVSGPTSADQQKKVEIFVQSAADYIKKNGMDKAIEEFNKKEGAFTKGDSYIFVLNYNGILLADPNNPDLVNKNEYKLHNADGEPLVQDHIALAKKGGGWIQYRWKEPITHAIGCKKSYIMPIGNDVLIGSGYYFPADPDGKCGF